MADFEDLKSQLKNDPSSFNLDEIKQVPEELDKVIDALYKIEKEEKELNDQQKILLSNARKYRDELKGVNSTFEKITESAEKSNNTFSKVLGTITGSIGAIDNLGRTTLKTWSSVVEPWGKVEQAAHDYGRTIGVNSKAVEQLSDQTIKFATNSHIGIKYGMRTDELIKLQTEYAKSLGRNIQIGDKQRESLVATSKLMGSNTTEYFKRLENLGIGLERSGDIAAKMFNDATKSGISFEKYSKTVTENLTKVQSYGFKNGVEGLTAMAKKATEVNMNIAEAFKIADKIETGGVQEAIKMGANLQVLGGSFARMGDPMGLLYEGLNDVEGLQERMISMFSGMGKLKNGQVQLSTPDRLRAKTAAQTLGISSDEMFNMINRRAVQEEVKKQISSSGNSALKTDAELMEYVKNTATLDKNGNAIVNLSSGPKSIKELNSDDKDELKALTRTESDNVADIAVQVRGFYDKQKGLAAEINNERAKMFSGWGETLSRVYETLGRTEILVKILAIGTAFTTITNGIGSIARGFKGIANIWKGKKGAASGGKSVRTLAESGGNAGKPAGNILKGVSRAGKGLKIAGGAAAGGAFAALGYLADGSFKGSRADKNKAIGGTAGATIGGLLSVFGPVAGIAGAMAGQFVGEKIGGAITKRQDKNRAEARERGENTLTGDALNAFKELKGDYSSKELEKLTNALKDGTISSNEINKGLMKKLMKSGDAELIEKLGDPEMKENFQKVVSKMSAKVENGDVSIDNATVNLANANVVGGEVPEMGTGGVIKGVSHEQGGVFINAEGGEYIIAKDAVAKNKKALDFINSGGVIDEKELRVSAISRLKEKSKISNFGSKINNILPSLANNPMTPLSVKAGIGIQDTIKRAISGENKMEVSPIKLDISGTIKLDAGGQQVDLNAIVNNPAFITQLSQMIERRLADNINGGNFKELKKNKQHTF